MLNHITLQGRLTKDPELKQTNGGVSVCNFRLAVDRDFKGQDGERKADFIPVIAWRGTADFANKYLAKGQMVVVEGRLQVESYKDKDGNNRTFTDVLANNIYFAGEKKERAEESFDGPVEWDDLPDSEEIPF